MGLFHKAALAASISTSLFAYVALTPTACAQGEPVHAYHLPVQSLATSLRAVSAASGRTIGMLPQLVANRQAPALEGSYTAEAAVAALLAGSGLHLHVAGNALIINAKGSGDQGLDEQANAPSTADGPEILVTGSLIRGAPIASPTIVIDRQAMLDTGATSLGDVMRNLPQSFGGGQNPGVGSNVPTAGGINVGSASTINLRGLGSDATLTLLDGHRLAYNGSRQGIDLSSIPFGMVEKVDVVADGASALYGSDAVAGVANIMLRHDLQGLETSANIGGATDGGDFQQQYGVVAGHRWNGGGLVAGYEYSSNTNIMSNDRSFAAVRPGVALYPALHHHAVALTGHQSLTDRLTFDVDATFNKRWSLGGWASNNAGDASLSHTDQASTSRSVSVAPSLKLDLPAGWRVQLSGVYGTETVHLDNRYYTGSALTTALRACYCNSGASGELAADGRLLTLPAGPVKLALGLGYRYNKFQQLVEGSTSNIIASQDSRYAYGEVSIPVIAPEMGVTAISRLNFSGALRYERYPGVASVATPKLGLIYAPFPDLVVKGSWGRSFRAPTLYQQYQLRSAYVYLASTEGGSGYPSTATGLLLSGGNPALKPERAETWTAMLDYSPHQIPGLNLQASYFSTIYRDRIVVPITYTSQSLSNPIYARYVTLSPSAAAVANIVNMPGFTPLTGTSTYDPSTAVAIIDNSSVNAGRQVIHGVDLLFNYKKRLHGQSGEIGLNGDIAYLTSSQVLVPGAAATQLAGTLFNPPHWRGRGSVSWKRGGFMFNATTSYIGGVSDIRTTTPIAVGGMLTQDFTARYDVGDRNGALHGVAFSLTAQNIFNDKPTTIATTSYASAAYDSTNYSPVGRYIGVGVTKSW
ncbi:TonB-dependent receptor plug domain-containing protein [Novosphingobium terrae]|uniref:TonB-dependent receptor plug domain-containing protein n=1 Tax=Novosphingobium terrae TaxID=2726189 RepID=UPI0019825E76|nr:TonB-dependent receptor [Novosphingobium terrae]